MIGQSDTCEGRGGRCYIHFSMGSGEGWGLRKKGGRLIHKLSREEDAAERRQLGRQADREEKVLEKNSVMASSCTGSYSPTARGLMCPLLSTPDQGSPA